MNAGFWDRVADTADRMSDTEGCRWHRELAPAAASVARAAFYDGGPICLVAYDAAGRYIGSVREADADRMRDHPNARPTEAAHLREMVVTRRNRAAS